MKIRHSRYDRVYSHQTEKYVRCAIALIRKINLERNVSALTGLDAKKIVFNKFIKHRKQQQRNMTKMRFYAAGSYFIIIVYCKSVTCDMTRTQKGGKSPLAFVVQNRPNLSFVSPSSDVEVL